MLMQIILSIEQIITIATALGGLVGVYVNLNNKIIRLEEHKLNIKEKLDAIGAELKDIKLELKKILQYEKKHDQ
jgi:hypothetical protein